MRRIAVGGIATLLSVGVFALGIGALSAQARDRRSDELRFLDLAVRMEAAHLADRMRTKAALGSAVGRLVPDGDGAAGRERRLAWLKDLQARYALAGVAVLDPDGLGSLGVGAATDVSEALADEAEAVSVTGEAVLYRTEPRTEAQASQDAWVDFLVPRVGVSPPAHREVVLVRLSLQQELQALRLASALDPRSSLTLHHARGELSLLNSGIAPTSAASAPDDPRAPRPRPSTAPRRAAVAASGVEAQDDGGAVLHASAPVGATGWSLEAREMSAGSWPVTDGASRAVLAGTALALLGIATSAWTLAGAGSRRPERRPGDLAGGHPGLHPGQRTGSSAPDLRQQMQWAVQHALDAVLLVGPATQVLEANESAASLFHRPRASLVGARLQDIFVADGTLDTVSDLPEGRTELVEFVHKTAGGGLLPVEGSARRIQIGGQALTQLLLRDVSLQKRQDSELRASVLRFRTLAESMPVGIFLSDLHGARQFANRRMAELTGWPQAQTGDAMRRDIIHPSDRERVGHEFDQAFAERRAARVEMQLLWPDGSVRSVIVQTEPERGADGAVVGFVGTLTDVTALRRRREDVEARARMLQVVFDSPFVCIVVVDAATGAMTMANKAACDLLGYSQQELLSRPWGDVTLPDERERAVIAIRACYRGEADGYRAHRRYRHRDGSVVPAMVDVHCLRQPGGRLESIVVVARVST